MRTVVAAVVLAYSVGLAVPAQADTLILPTPADAQAASDKIIQQLPGFRPDRILHSNVPGPVINDEVVRVGLGGDGGVRSVITDQRLELTGEGDYAIRERGPARSASSLSAEPPPVTRRGAVVWQGFSPGRRALAARLTLDPQIEAPHLPLTMAITFTSRDGGTQGLLDGGDIPGAGIVRITITNSSGQPQVLPTADDVAPTAVAGVLDRALAVARRPAASRLPSTDHGLPKTITVVKNAQIQASQAVPYRLGGSLTVTGTTATISGPATTATATGATFAGTLGGSSPQNGTASVTFTVDAAGAGKLALDLTAVATLNPTELAPPNGFATWRRWASSHPPQAERKAALDLLIAVAATGARASAYSPYLGADLVGVGSTTFTYAFARPAATAALRAPLHPKWGAISLAVVALLLLLTNSALIWRRS